MAASRGPSVAQALASSTSLVVLLPTARRTHRRARTINMASASDTNCNFDDINKSMDSYLDMLFYEWYKQWKRNLHKHYELFDASEVAVDEGCLLELEDWPDKWAWVCGHFEDATYVVRLYICITYLILIVLKIIPTLGYKFPEIDVFNDVYVWPRDELAKQLHIHRPLEVCLPASFGHSYRVCGSAQGCGVSNLD
ncbi:hypothetical protein D8674_017467 [Pyrus ussuriensis x Pyrus communis]|uniref:Uncharacterized protein n=1 Tax=Pyrus ussuriensis x Pyrus communis TaxID=2448454 RepID=A0A5N5HFX7_9ROSA|nr:hypothetical protein D8674_017467 [Pyrus ussuriensis x Pyrus communis]